MNKMSLCEFDEEHEDFHKSEPSSSTWNGVSSAENKLRLQLALEEFCDAQTPLNSVYLLQVLYNIHRRILDYPAVDKYYRIYIKGDIFERYVWVLIGSENFMIYSGWVKCGNYLVLSKGFPVKQSVVVIEDMLKKKKRAQALHSGSLQREKKHSTLGTKKCEDEILDTYAHIESPTESLSRSSNLHESDSAFGSGIDDDDEQNVVHRKAKLRRVESRESAVGKEQYVVVDFVNHDDVSAKDIDESPESAISVSPTSMNSTFEEILTSDVLYYDHSVNDEAHETDDSQIKEVKFKHTITEKEVNKDILQPKNFIEVECEKPAAGEYNDLIEPTKANSTEKFEAKKVQNETIKNDTHKNDVENIPSIASIQQKRPTKVRGNKGLKHIREERERAAKKIANDQKENVKTLQLETTEDNIKHKKSASSLNQAGNQFKKTDPTIEELTNNRINRADSNLSNSSMSSLSRHGSIKSITSDTSVKSIVMQNKLLFDRQIAEEKKRKHASTTSLESKPKKLSQVDTSVFEKRSSFRNSYNSDRRPSELNTGELNISGIVAGTKGMFENNNKKSTSVNGLSYRQKKDSDSWNDKKIKSTESSGSLSSSVPSSHTVDSKIISDGGIIQKEEIVKKKKKGVFKKKKKNTEGNKNKESIAVDENEHRDEEIFDHPDDEKKKKGLFSRIKKHSKSYEIDERKQSTDRNSNEFDSLANATKPVELNLQNDDTKSRNIVSRSSFESDVKLDGSCDVEDQKTIEKYDITAELQTILDKPLSSPIGSLGKGNKKRIFKKKKRTLSNTANNTNNEISATVNTTLDIKNDELNLTPEISPSIPIELNDSVFETVINDNNKVDNSTSHIDDPVSLDEPDANPEIENLVIEATPTTVVQMDIKPVPNNNITTENSEYKDVSKQQINDKENNIGELVYERVDDTETVDIGPPSVLPQISVTESEYTELASTEHTSSINNASSDDDLVQALERAANQQRDDGVQLQQANGLDSPITLKKKKKFPFHIKGSSSKKEKKEKKETLPDNYSPHLKDKLSSIKGSKKSKRPKALDIHSSSNDLSVSTDDLSLDLQETEKSKKKNRINLFRSKKKKDSPVKSSSFISYADSGALTPDFSDTQNQKFLSSDEFTIPETTDSNPATTRKVSGSSSNEYSKKDELIEIEANEPMAF